MAGSGNVLSARLVRPARGVIARPAGPRPAIEAVAVPGQEGGKGEAGRDGASGNALTLTAGLALSGHRVVRPSADGRAVYASCLVLDDAGAAIGVTAGAADENAPVTVNVGGDIVEPSWAFAPGPVWLGPAGTLVQPRPTIGFLRQIGVAITPTRLAVMLGSPLILAP